ncbi:hypothetical protein CC86DRAFT_385884 [Ophiobolus disseminans]|uniref:Uncharacterized protein n=1 Tax=Ophiobolus disseminans TaxID=1469910 RepID=A0A6A6ZMR4_9PLEO|nr:hypothetical protein CC86DRAFT_385884 [Ophiobolus disseminans]
MASSALRAAASRNAFGSHDSRRSIATVRSHRHSKALSPSSSFNTQISTFQPAGSLPLTRTFRMGTSQADFDQFMTEYREKEQKKIERKKEKDLIEGHIKTQIGPISAIMFMGPLKEANLRYLQDVHEAIEDDLRYQKKYMKYKSKVDREVGACVRSILISLLLPCLGLPAAPRVRFYPSTHNIMALPRHQSHPFNTSRHIQPLNPFGGLPNFTQNYRASWQPCIHPAQLLEITSRRTSRFQYERSRDIRKYSIVVASYTAVTIGRAVFSTWELHRLASRPEPSKTLGKHTRAVNGESTAVERSQDIMELEDYTCRIPGFPFW